MGLLSLFPPPAASRRPPPQGGIVTNPARPGQALDAVRDDALAVCGREPAGVEGECVGSGEFSSLLCSRAMLRRPSDLSGNAARGRLFQHRFRKGSPTVVGGLDQPRRTWFRPQLWANPSGSAVSLPRTRRRSKPTAADTPPPGRAVRLSPVRVWRFPLLAAGRLHCQQTVVNDEV